MSSPLITKQEIPRKNAHVTHPLSRLWKGIEDDRRVSSKAVEVSVDSFEKLIEQVI